MKRKKFGFTIVELLVVIAIIALLISILLPALNMVRNKAKETKQRAYLTTIELALAAFRNDYGDYPPSDNTAGNYCGAQKLSEALLGRDLLGFHPNSNWHATTDTTYYPPNPTEDDLKARRDPYLERETANAFKLKNIFSGSVLDPETFVLCDVYGTKKVKLGTKTVKAGAPILYYRANTSSKNINDSDFAKRIYNSYDNVFLVRLQHGVDVSVHTLLNNFYDFIRDPKVEPPPAWPYRPDSYILISAGADGKYGTNDDICNFGD